MQIEMNTEILAANIEIAWQTMLENTNIETTNFVCDLLHGFWIILFRSPATSLDRWELINQVNMLGDIAWQLYNLEVFKNQ